ncbi:hypothetical protein CCUS01_17387 [Colletotrichum cuscutae]|uniref:Uncharacterized protein n=1 Tax=Colletotrichum cuscutae TaxID=1209917 RepID=A0AAI9Y4B8_9PEZI|nr:hypothetical protein CCUS01_17387 [Colletotrichum cuscutae]
MLTLRKPGPPSGPSLQSSFLLQRPLLFPTLIHAPPPDPTPSGCPTSVHAASLRQELRQGHRHPKTTTQPDRLCSQSLFFFLPFPIPNQTSQETGTVSKSQEAHHPPSSAKSSFHVYRLGTTTNAQSHTFNRHNDRMPFFFCKLSCQCSLHDNAPLRRGRGGVLSYAQTLASFPGTSFQTFRNPAHFQVYQSPSCQSIKVALSPPQPL